LKFTIKKGKPTKNHGNTLTALGYTVVEHDDHFEIEAEPFNGVLDLTKDNKKEIKQLIKMKQLVTYKTPILVKKGEAVIALKSILACSALDRVKKGLSCLMAKTEIDNDFSDFLD